MDAAAAKLLQSCPTLCDPIDGSPPGSPVPGILQAKTLEWVATSFSSAWKWKVKVKSLSRVRLSVTPWTATFQAPPSMGLSRQEYWSGVPLPSLSPIQSVEGLNRTKRLTFPPEEGILHQVFRSGSPQVLSSLDSQLELHPSPFLGLQLAYCRSRDLSVSKAAWTSSL